MNSTRIPSKSGLTALDDVRAEKIRAFHRERLAVVYVRQSTVQQVLDHQESTRLQYVRGGLATVTLNRPDVLNTISTQMAEELLDCITSFSAEESVRAVLLCGAGRAFCAGMDLKSPTAYNSSPGEQPDSVLDRIIHPIIVAIRNSSRPFVGAVQGACVGIGVALALACDLVVAEEGAYFLLPYARLGIGLDGGISAFLVERIHLARAAELCLLGERLPAEQALEWGIINRVYPRDRFADQAHDFATRLANGPSLALDSIKQALSTAAHPHLAEQLQLESNLTAECSCSVEYVQARSAITEGIGPTLFPVA